MEENKDLLKIYLLDFDFSNLDIFQSLKKVFSGLKFLAFPANIDSFLNEFAKLYFFQNQHESESDNKTYIFHNTEK